MLHIEVNQILNNPFLLLNLIFQLFIIRNRMNKESLELCQYKEYVNSTQRLNDALNRQLITCYDRIDKMMNELAQAENLNSTYLKQIESLKNQTEELKLQKSSVLRTKASERIFSFESIGDSSNGSRSNGKFQSSDKINTANKKNIRLENRGTQTKKQKTEADSERIIQDFQQRERQFAEEVNLQISRLQAEILSQRQELDLVHCEKMETYKTIQLLGWEVKKREQKCEDIQNARINIIHEMMTQKQALLYQIKKKDQALVNLQEKTFVQSKQLAWKNNQSLECNNLRQTVANLEVENKRLIEQLNITIQINQEMQTKINSLEQHINIIENRNSLLRSASKQQEKKQNKSIQMRKSTLLQTELKMVKQQYTQVVKQNITLTETNSKLQRKRCQLIKDVEGVKKQKSQIFHMYNELQIQYQHLLIENKKKELVVQDMSHKITIKENEAQKLKTKASQQIIEKLERSLTSPMSPKVQQGIFESVRPNNFNQIKDGQVPVRDTSRSVRMIKSKSTVIAYGQR